MLVSNFVLEDNLDVRTQSADFERRVNNAVQSFMESVERMLADEPQVQPAYQFARDITPAEWLATA